MAPASLFNLGTHGEMSKKIIAKTHHSFALPVAVALWKIIVKLAYLG